MNLFNRSEKFTLSTMKTGKWVYKREDTIEIEKESTISAYAQLDKKYLIVKTQNLHYKYQILELLHSTRSEQLYMREYVVINDEGEGMALHILLINKNRLNIILSSPDIDNLNLKIPFITFIGFTN